MPGSTPLNSMMAEMTEAFVSKVDFDALTVAVDVDKRNLDIAWIILCSEYVCMFVFPATQKFHGGPLYSVS
jgi:hypothetical protein